MSSLKYNDRMKFEKLFGMSSGYVLDFTNRTFSEFISMTLGIDIYDGTYGDNYLSKANLLRGFWTKADDTIVAKLNKELLSHWNSITLNKTQQDITLCTDCQSICDIMQGKIDVINLEALAEVRDKETLDVIIKEIKRNVADNNPEMSLDRLHTFMMGFGRSLCSIHDIEFNESEALNSLFGKYNKWLNDNNILESRIARRIIGISIGLLEDLNYIRNNQSAAHSNPLLNKHESLFAIDSICSIVHFINKIEDIISVSQLAKIENEYIPY